MDKTPHKPLKDACRLCDTTFNDIKERHQLLFGALEVKPAYTVALEEITGPLQTSDEFISVCGSCRTLLDRYHTSCCEVERIGSLVKKLTHNNTSDRVKGGLNEVKSTQTEDSSSCDTRKRIKVEPESPERLCCSEAAVSQTAGHSAVETSSSRPQPQSQLLLQSQHAPQPPVQASTEGAVRRKPVTVAPVVWSAHSVQSAVCSLKPRPQPQSQLQSRHLSQPTALSSNDGAVRKKLVTITPALHSQPVQAAVSQTAGHSAVETSSSSRQPQSQLLLQSQHAPQLPVQASTEGAVRRKPVTVAPVVWSAHSVQSAVCSLKPRPQPQSQLQSTHLPQLTSLSSDDGAVRKKLVTIAPALHSQPVQAAVGTSRNRPQLLLQSQHAPQPTVQASTEGAVRRKPVTVAPVVWSAHSVQSAVCSLKPRPQPQSQLQSRHLPQLTALSSDDGAVRKKLVTIAPALHSQPVQNQLDGRHTVTGCGQSTPSLYPALTAAESMGHGASTLSASTRVPMSKQSKIIIRTPFSVRSRIVRGPLERVLENIVKGRLNRIPHAIMSVPGLFDAVVKEVLDVIKKECKKLTSLKFTSILRQTSMKDLNNFKWMDVVAEWRMNAPTYLKFLESASSVSMEATTSRIRPVSHSKTNKYKLPMAGAILLNARCSSMSAHMYRNAMFICRGGAKRRFQRLNQLGVCISDGRALAKLKEMGQTWDSNFLQWKESVCQEDTASNLASGGADSSEFTASDECQDNAENRMSPEHAASIKIESDVMTPCKLCSDDEDEQQDCGQLVPPQSQRVSSAAKLPSAGEITVTDQHIQTTSCPEVQQHRGSGVEHRVPSRQAKKAESITGLAGRSCFGDYSGVQTGEERGRGGSMSTDEEPTYTVKLMQLLLLSTYWGMQIWVTFISSFVMDNHLNRHTYGFIQSRLVPFYLHLGSACAFFNLTIYAVYHPCDMLDERESFQIFIFFVSVTVAAVNAQWFGQMTSEIMADMHLIEQACGLGQDIGLSSNREAYAKLCETDVKYRHLSGRLWLYRLLSSLCNLCCIGCNFYSLCYMAENLGKL